MLWVKIVKIWNMKTRDSLLSTLNHVYVDFANSKNCRNFSEVMVVSSTKSQFLRSQNFKFWTSHIIFFSFLMRFQLEMWWSHKTRTRPHWGSEYGSSDAKRWVFSIKTPWPFYKLTISTMYCRPKKWQITYKRRQLTQMLINKRKKYIIKHTTEEWNI